MGSSRHSGRIPAVPALARLSGLDPPKIFFSAQVVDLQASNFQKSPKEAVVKT
jgi:hypothetical protein